MGAHARPRVPWLQLPPPGSGQLRSHHVSRGTSSRLPAQGSFGAVTCRMAPAPTSRLRAAPRPPRVPWLPPLGSGQLRDRHVSHGGTTGWEPLKKPNTPWRRDHHNLHRDAHASSKALRDKDSAARLQGMQQAVH
jgi:hypothetical protein